MKRIMLIFVLAVFCLASAPKGIAEKKPAQESIGFVELVVNNVHFREKAAGKSLGLLKIGECLPLYLEKRAGESRWYLVHSDEYGYGYIRSDMAVLVDGNQRLVQSGKVVSTLTEKLKHFLEAAAYYQVEGRFERWNAQDKIDFVLLMYKDNILAQDEAYEKLLSDTLSANEKEKLASDILYNHYGSEKLSIVVVRYEDWVEPEVIYEDHNWYMDMLTQASEYYDSLIQEEENTAPN